MTPAARHALLEAAIAFLVACLAVAVIAGMFLAHTPAPKLRGGETVQRVSSPPVPH
jgi:hypothetical protein